jgi:glycosyltransferase involved in cell wall biosynthesis
MGQLCSRSEGFLNAAVETLAMGCYVVTTPVAAIPEVICERQTGLPVSVDKPDELAASVQGLRRDAGLRERLTGCVRSRYHQTVVIAQLKAVYQSVARIDGKQRVALT